jgi:hypothetical protein
MFRASTAHHQEVRFMYVANGTSKMPVSWSGWSSTGFGHSSKVARRELGLGGGLSEEVRVTSGVPQGSVLGPLLFLAYVNNIWRNMESTFRLFADDCVIYRKIIEKEDMDILQKNLEWATENAMKINPSKSKAICFTRARAQDPLNY